MTHRAEGAHRHLRAGCFALALGLALAVATPTPAVAEFPVEPVVATDTTATATADSGVAVPRLPARKLPDPHQATMLSVYCTLIPAGVGLVASVAAKQESGVQMVVLAGSIVLGPAVGYFYGGLPARGSMGVLLRATFALGGLVAAAGLGLGDAETAFNGAVYVTSACVIGLGVYDVAVVGGNVRRANEKRAVAVTVTPWVSPEWAPGLALRARF